MKKKMLWVAVLGVLLLAGNSWAGLVAGDYVLLKNGPGNDPGGSFGLYKWSDSTNLLFKTFCIEKNEYFYFEEQLKIDSISNIVLNGGAGANTGSINVKNTTYTTNSGGQLSSQAAWLYSYYIQSYGLSGSSSNEINTAFQTAIWAWENELGLNDSLTDMAFNLFELAGKNAQNGNFYGVQALNLMRKNSSGNWINAQSQLIYVPEPATMILLGFGLLGLAGIGRRRFKS